MSEIAAPVTETAPSAFARELRDLRTERGWLQRDLARASGYDRGHISRFELDVREPSRAAVDLLSHALDDRDGRLYLAAGMLPDWLYRLLRQDRVSIDRLAELFRELRARSEALEGTIDDWQ